MRVSRWYISGLSIGLCLLAPPLLGQVTGVAPDARPPAIAYTQQAWTVRDGLPVNHVNEIYQTPDGYLWMATFAGLVRFDGVHFTVYNAANTPGMPSSRLGGIQRGLGNSFWLVTEQGHLLRFQNGQVRTVSSAYGSHQSRVFADGDSVLWVMPPAGLLREQNGELVPYASEVIGGETVRHLLRASSGDLWLAVPSGVWRIGLGRPVLLEVSGMGSQGAHLLYEDAAGAVWAFGAGIARYTGGAFQTVVPPGARPGQFAHPVVFPGSPDVSGNVLLSSAQDLFRLRPGDPSPTWAYFDPGVPQTDAFAVCPDRALWSTTNGRLYREGRLVLTTKLNSRGLYCDREGNVWLMTRNEGLHRFRPANVQTVGDAPGAPAFNVYGVFEDKSGAVWLGSMEGRLRRYENDVVQSRPRLDGNTAAFLEAADGALWIGRHRCAPEHRTADGCARFAREEKLPFGVLAIKQTRDGAIWFGTDKGLFRLQNGAWTFFTTTDGLPPYFARHFLETQDGTLWVATNGGGIARYSGTGPGANAFKAITVADGLASDNVRALYEDAHGMLWIATEDRGLAQLDPETGTIVSIREADGLYDDGLHTVIEDDWGRLWMSTNRGLFWVLREDLDAFARGEASRVLSTFYTERDGMRNREANGGYQNAAHKASDGRLWFATQDGAVVVDPRNLGQVLPPAPVVIESVKTARRSVSAFGGTPLSLSAAERSFSVRYSAPGFAAPERMRFRYKLAGFDADWVNVEDRREAIYTNVPPGTYTLFVASSTSGDAWNEAGVPVTLSVAPFFYETWWFALIGILAGVAGLGGFYQYRTRALRHREATLWHVVEERTRELQAAKDQTEEQADQLRALDQAKSRLFANVSHEFRTPLTLTIGPLEDVRSNRYGPLVPDAAEQIDLALQNARRLLRLINQILDVSKLESGQLHLQTATDDLVPFVHGIGLAFAAAAERRGIHYRIELPAEPIRVCFDPNQLDKVFANLLSNSLKFTPEGGAVRLTMRLSADAEGTGHVAVSVCDTGPGIPSGELPHIFERFHQVDSAQQHVQPGTGIGLSLARELTELHKGTLAVESEEGTGSTFTVTLPLDTSNTGENEPTQLQGHAGDGASWAVEHGQGATKAVNAVLETHAAIDQTTLLVVDDNADIRSYMRQHFEPGYRVVEASEGGQALERARQVLPDLIVSDVMMPGMDGFALCDALKQDPALDFIPVILLTAKATAASRIEGYARGADAYVMKPFDMQELIARVENLIASRKRLRARFGSAPPSLTPGDSSPIASADAVFVERVRGVVEAHLDDESFGVIELAAAVGLSRSQLHRRLQAVLGESPSDVMRAFRLERAADLLRARAGLVSEIAYAVGFRSISYFSTCFHQRYGRTPSAYMAEALPADSDQRALPGL